VGVQIFVSYARDDDAVPADVPPERGFVSFLCDQLIYEFKNNSLATRPALWRDIKRIEKGEEFEQRFKEQLATSAIMLIILSNNWLDRSWCANELQLFASQWSKDGEEGVRRRVVFAAKNFISYDRRPSLIQGKEGYEFFSLEGKDGDAPVREAMFFDRGEVWDRAHYYARVKELGRYLYELAQKYSADGNVTDSRPPENKSQLSAEADPPRKNKENTMVVGATRPARTIYVAQPAADMREAYDRVVKELQGRDFAIAPDPGSEIPKDDTATEFVDAALARSEFSIHLLGEKLGYAPDGTEPILKLQIARAAAKIAKPSVADFRHGSFFRLFWAPRTLVTNGVGTNSVRDPIAVLANLDRQLDSDKVEGESLSRFIDFLIQRIDVTEKPQQAKEMIDANTSVYINHRIEDIDSAIQFGKLLAGNQIEVLLPCFEGDPKELRSWHRKHLQNADSVLLCWAKAPDVWVSTSAQELRNWRSLKRKQRFACRLLVAAPPPGQTKRLMLNVPPRSDIDAVVDLTQCDEPPPDAFDSLIRASRLQAT
jgi:hypothetical protein